MIKKFILLSLFFVILSFAGLQAQDEDIGSLHKKAMGLMRNEQYEEAIKVFKEILAEDPDNSIALYNTACAYSLLDKKKLAIEFLARAIKSGYDRFNHMAKDSDLDNIRNEPEYKKLIRRALQGKKKPGELAVQCGSEIKWLKDFAEAKKEAASTNKIIFCFAYHPKIPPGQKYSYSFLVKKGPLMQRGLINFVNHKFIPLRLSTEKLRKTGIEHPVLKEKAFLLDGTVIFITPEGNILKKISTTNAGILLKTCMDILQKNKQYNQPGTKLLELEKKVQGSPSDLQAHFELAELYTYEHKFIKAEEIMRRALKISDKAKDNAEIYYKLSAIARYSRHISRALEYLNKLKELDPDNKLGFADDISIQEGLLQIEARQYKKAREIFSEAIEKFPESNRLAEIYYGLGITHSLVYDKDKAKTIWKKLINEMPDTRWSWMAGANLIESRCASWEVVRESSEIEDVVGAGLEYLLKNQLPDGSWHVPGRSGSNYKKAITAICCLALYEWQKREPKRIQPALKKALSYLENAVKSGKLSQRTISRNYSKIWNLIYSLHLFSTLAAEEKEKYEDYVKKLVKSMEGLQTSGDGGWSYHGRKSESFTTGAGIISLLQAKKTAEVAKETLEKAIKCIKSFQKEPAYEYWKVPSASIINGQIVPKPERDWIEGNAARLPICELVLYLNKERKSEDLVKAMEVFCKYKEKLLRVRKNPVYHVDLYWNSGYYFFFGYYYASLCVSKLSPELQKKYFPIIRQDILSINESDGSWVDHYEFGKPYATGMALLILKNIGK